MSILVVPELGLLPVLLVLVVIGAIVVRYTSSWSWYGILTIATLVVISVSPFAIQVEVVEIGIDPIPPREPTVDPDAENQLALTTQRVELDKNQLEDELLIGFYNDENQSRAFDPDLKVCLNVNSSDEQVPYFKLIHDEGQVVESNGTGQKQTILVGDKRAVGKGPFLCKLTVHDLARDIAIEYDGDQD